MVVHVLAAEELHPTLVGDLELVDREGGGRVVVSLAADTIEEYEQATAAWLERVRGRCSQVGAGLRPHPGRRRPRDRPARRLAPRRRAPVTLKTELVTIGGGRGPAEVSPVRMGDGGRT